MEKVPAIKRWFRLIAIALYAANRSAKKLIFWSLILWGALAMATGLLATVPYFLAIIGMLTASYFSDMTLNRKLFIWPFLLIGSLAFYGSYLLGTSSFWVSFVGAYIVGYLNGSTGGFGAFHIFMAGSLFISAILTLLALKSYTSKLAETA